MSINTNDIGALAYLARRIREETIGASKWDEPGIAAGVRRMIDRGFGFDEILDQVVDHARDKAAKNPGVLGHPVTTPPPEVRVRRGVTRDQQCDRCGLRKVQCACDPMAKGKPAVASTDDHVRPELERAREAIAAARGGS